MAVSNTISIKDFKKMTDSDRKKMKKDTIINMILSSTESPEVSDLSVAIKGLTELVKGFKNECEENSLKVIEMKVELEMVKNENRTIKKELSTRINNLEQRSRINNLEVIGLRKPSNLENETVLTLGFLNEIMKAKVDVSDVDALHEVPSKRTDKKRIVVVALKYRSKRDEILKCKSILRKYNESLEDQSTRVFVNEHLSPDNKKLFAMAAKLKHELGYKYLWTKQGIVFLRKDDDSRYIRISSEDELSQVTGD
jgi:hypothetical protein